MFDRFTRIAVRTSPKAKAFVVVYPEIRDGSVVGVSPLFGAVLPLKGTMQAITAGQQTSDAFRLGTDVGSVYSIEAKSVSRKPETLSALMARNPWKAPVAEKFAKALRS